MFSILESEEASLTLVHLISLLPSRRRLGEDGFPSDIFLHSILQSAGPASARACHAPDERLVPDTRLSQPQPTDSTLDSTPSPSFARLRRPNNDNTVVHRLSLPAGPGREGVCNSYCLLIQSQTKFSVPHRPRWGLRSVTTHV